MARNEQDREDIFREATALVERIELQLAEFDEPVVVGFRRNGCASFYLGADLVFQFNTQGQLRRMYYGGRLIKALHGKLHAMERVRTATEVELRSRVLTDDESNAALRTTAQKLSDISEMLKQDARRVTGQAPADRNVLSRVQQWLDDHAHQITVADEPHAR